jgi:hypothetical protein
LGTELIIQLRPKEKEWSEEVVEGIMVQVIIVLDKRPYRHYHPSHPSPAHDP